MKVCRNCLEKLNYKMYNGLSTDEKNAMVDNFSINEFYKQYDDEFMYIPSYLTDEYRKINEELLQSYTEDWGTISREFREAKKIYAKYVEKIFQKINIIHKFIIKTITEEIIVILI